jgi:hypothetical protein
MQTYQMNRDRDQLRRDLAAMTEERDERTVERDSERRRAAYAEGLLSKANSGARFRKKACGLCRRTAEQNIATT